MQVHQLVLRLVVSKERGRGREGRCKGRSREGGRGGRKLTSLFEVFKVLILDKGRVITILINGSHSIL